MPIEASATSGRPGIGGGSRRLLQEISTPVRFVHAEHAELARARHRHLDHADRDVRFLLDVEANHRAVVHLVDVVAREHQHVQRAVRADDVHVLPQRIGRAHVPFLAAPLLRRDDLDELAELAAQVAQPRWMCWMSESPCTGSAPRSGGCRSSRSWRAQSR